MVPWSDWPTGNAANEGRLLLDGDSVSLQPLGVRQKVLLSRRRRIALCLRPLNGRGDLFLGRRLWRRFAARSCWVWTVTWVISFFIYPLFDMGYRLIYVTCRLRLFYDSCPNATALAVKS